MASRFTRNVISEAPVDKTFNWNTQVNDLINDGVDIFYHDTDDNIRQLSQNREVADLYKITAENRRLIDENRKDIDKNRKDIDENTQSIITINNKLKNYYTKTEVDNLLADLLNKIDELDSKILELTDQTRDNIDKIVTGGE